MKLDKSSEELWLSTMIAGSTERLIEAARNYLGKIKTPYDKRQIATKLIAYLRKPGTQDLILKLIDDQDARLLGFLCLAGPVHLHDLKELYTDELSLFELNLRVANLSDRLLVYTVQQGSRNFVLVNPILLPRLTELTLDAHLLFASTAKAKHLAAWSPLASTATLMAYAFFLFHGGTNVLKKNGEFSKRSKEELARLFPAAVKDDFSFLQDFNEFFVREFGFVVGEEFSSQHLDQLQKFVKSYGDYAIFALAYKTPISTMPSIELLIALVTCLDAVPREFSFSFSGLVRWIYLGIRKFAGEAAALNSATLLQKLHSFQFVRADEHGHLLLAPARFLPPAEEAPAGKPVLVAQGAHALHLMPHAQHDDHFFVARLARLISFDRIWNFEFDKSSLRHAFMSGVRASDLVARLQRMSGTELSQALTFQITEWEREYQSARVYEGFVLAVDERRAPHVEHSKVLAPFLGEKLSPTIYMINVPDLETLNALLREAGIEAMHHRRQQSNMLLQEQVTQHAGKTSDTHRVSTHSPHQASEENFLQEIFSAEFNKNKPRVHIAGIEDNLKILRNLVRNIEDGALKKELLDRIERKLILSEEQLTHIELHPIIHEAKGLDYCGKLRIIEAALKTTDDRLEIKANSANYDNAQLTVRPTRLEKGEKGLILCGENLVSGEPLKLPLSAISSVRRLRASIFGEKK